MHHRTIQCFKKILSLPQTKGEPGAHPGSAPVSRAFPRYVGQSGGAVAVSQTPTEAAAARPRTLG